MRAARRILRASRSPTVFQGGPDSESLTLDSDLVDYLPPRGRTASAACTTQYYPRPGAHRSSQVPCSHWTASTRATRACCAELSLSAALADTASGQLDITRQLQLNLKCRLLWCGTHISEHFRSVGVC